ncbi:MAG: hypothetical protein A2V66_05115 [Ignavibacteria bacterium RBG_13_36_8]|nr:MAG: hypothetical protein A2V66_05115 [Ignavibacteria bacterium RBG_13_36_8]
MRIKWILILPMLSFIISSCSKDNSSTNPIDTNDEKTITILYTNDEHGWMEPADTYSGAAGMLSAWVNTEGYSESGNYLILSGGDMWTGPAPSAWFEGEPMVQVMNAMHYNAAAIGNHEVDFGIDELLERKNQASFSFLSANIYTKGTSDYPEFCQPYVTIEVDNISVGIIGLTTLYMPGMVFPQYVENLDFISYQQALARVVPELRALGVELIILISHMSAYEMRSVAPIAKQYGIYLIGGGHSHELITEDVNGVTIIESGSYLRNYVRADILFDDNIDSVLSISTVSKVNNGSSQDAVIQNIISYWQNQSSGILNQVIGYTSSGIDQSSPQMYNMITDSWLYSYPNADIAVCNKGGVRQSIPAGNITVSTIIGILPFENYIVEVELTEQQLINSINSSVFVGGMTTIGGYSLSDGTPINLTQTYKVLFTDFWYTTSATLPSYDSAPEYTNINWRQPVIDWIISLNTSPTNPLENYLDSEPRQNTYFVFED